MLRHLRHLPVFQQLRDIYGWKDEYKKGRSISLISTLMTSFYNVFITGIFYTGFLSMYDIDLVGAGIITFIPPLANCFVIFSPMILERIKKRKWILVAAKIYFYAMYIIATNLMPLFVTDPGQRVTWFCIIQFLSHAVYALFSAGFTPWFYAFYPSNQQQRAAYISYNQIFGSVLSSFVQLFSGVLTSMIEGSGNQNAMILGMRYFAFVLVLIDVFAQSLAKEYPYPVRKGNVKLREVFTLSLKYKKFMACMILMFIWNYVSNLNNGLWNYYLLNTVGLSYATINTVSALYAISLFLFTPFWRRMLSRYSWIRTFAIGVILFAPTELVAFCLSPNTQWIYVPLALMQHFLSVGLNLSYANILYLNMPTENATTHTCFQSVFCNICAFLGLMTGTYFCRWMGDTTHYLFSIPITAVQYTTVMRFFALAVIGIVLMKVWRKLTPDDELEALDLANGRA